MITEVAAVQRARGVVAAAASDPGRLRDHNEDVFYLDLEHGTMLVVDGVGGQAGGDVAARIAAETIRRRLERNDAHAEVRVREAITLANNAIHAKATSTPGLEGMACVLTLAVLEGSALTIGHVGDSRLYKLDAHGISKLTHDHSPVGELEDSYQISEAEAMQHDRRNEVYRDVGSMPRDPDSPDFIEVLTTTFDPDAAILICSDGLTDMLPALEINRIVRLHRSEPDSAAAALVAAANAAGGKDNITVLIAEGRTFRTTPDGGRSLLPALHDDADKVPTLPLEPMADLAAGPEAPALRTPDGNGQEREIQSSSPARGHAFWRSFARSRSVALLVGAILGLAVAVFVALTPDGARFLRPDERRLIVGGTTAGAFATIGGALAAARAGDVVQVEPGEYAEAVVMPAGVELRAVATSQAVLVAPPGGHDWIAISASEPGATVRGLRIVGTPHAPVAIGIAIDGTNVQVDDVTFEGDIRVGVAIHRAGAVLRSSRFDELSGIGVRVEQTDASVRQNVFRSAGDKSVPALQTVGAAPAVHGNVFVHFARPVETDGRAEDLIGRDNYVIPPGR